MRKFISILKVFSLVLLLIIVGIAFVFFLAWQKNERPEVKSASWDKDTVSLAHPATLNLEIRTPWHREIRSTDPMSVPSFLVPVRNKAILHRGMLGIGGYRNWIVSLPLVPTDLKEVKGQALTISLAPTRRPSAKSVHIPLPELSIYSPGNLPDMVDNTLDFLTEESIAVEKESEQMTESGFPWLAAILMLLTLVAIVFVYLRIRSKRLRIPPWERALAELSRLEKQSSLPVDQYYSNLTDILKSYTADRFSVPANAKTSTEFLQTLNRFTELPTEKKEELSWLAALADQVKFAEHRPEKDHSSRALGVVRRFIKKTIPTPDLKDA